MRAKKLLKISSLRWASARLSPSMYVMGFCQGFIANISRSTRASVPLPAICTNRFTTSAYIVAYVTT